MAISTFIFAPMTQTLQLDTSWLPVRLRSLFQPLKLAPHKFQRAGHLALSHSCEDPRPTPQEAGAQTSQKTSQTATLATKKRLRTPSLSPGLIKGDDVVQTCGPSNMALTGTCCGVSSGPAARPSLDSTVELPPPQAQLSTPGPGPRAPGPPKASPLSQWMRTLLECSGGPRNKRHTSCPRGSCAEAICKVQCGPT